MQSSLNHVFVCPGNSPSDRPRSNSSTQPAQLFLDDAEPTLMLSSQSTQNAIATEEQESASRKRELEQIESAVADIQQMFEDMKIIVASQQQSLDELGSNLDRTRDNVDRGAAQLRQAAQHVGSALIGGLVGAAIGGPVGLMAVGAAKAATLFAASGAVVGAAAANAIARFQRREAEEQEQELAEFVPKQMKQPPAK